MTLLLIDPSASLLTFRHIVILSMKPDFYPALTVGFLQARFWGKFLWVDVYWCLLWNITQTVFDRHIFIDLELKWNTTLKNEAFCLLFYPGKQRIKCIKCIFWVVGPICIQNPAVLTSIQLCEQTVHGSCVEQVCVELCRAIFNLKKKKMCKTFANVIPVILKQM